MVRHAVRLAIPIRSAIRTGVMKWHMIRMAMLLAVVAGGRGQRLEADDSSEERLEPTKKGDAVVANFVDTLMSSTRYLKMVDDVSKKMSMLELNFQERTSSILKYLSEVLRVVKVQQHDELSDSIHSLRPDINKLQLALAECPISRDSQFHHDPTFETRFGILENSIKNVNTGVESILSVISEVKSRNYAKPQHRTEGGVTSTQDINGIITEFRRALHDQRGRKCDCKTSRSTERYPTDCYEIQMQGFNVTGIYKIKPEDMEPFYVLCDLMTSGGGWTVFQSRFDGSQDFFKPWADYKHGFGNLAGEFWLGLERMHYLTNQKLYELRVEVETQLGQEAFAGYSVFTVGPEFEGYRISTLGTYYGTAGDSLSYHAGQKFSTLDVDSDDWKDGACATEHGGAWWYKECDKSNLNGKYTTSVDENRGQNIYWISFKGPKSLLTKTKMMIRPLPASRPTFDKKVSPDSPKPLEATRARVDQPRTRVEAPRPSHGLGYSYGEPLQSEPFFPNYA